jgi:MraZ protein
VLRGNSPAKIDDKGRLKVPNGFRAVIQDTHGRDLFVTSLSGESVRIYPMPVWLDIERRLAQVPSSHPSRQKYLDRVNFFGQVS